VFVCICCAAFHLRLQPVGRKVMAALLVFLSGCVVWSEATIFTGGHPDLSPFSRAIRCVGTVGVCGLGKQRGMKLLGCDFKC
jgi:hypothetical protein